MSDFGEICPLFNTGVFNELIFPRIKMTDISTTANALLGTNDCHASSLGDFTFGRTVVITAAWIRKKTTPAAAETMVLNHHTSKLADGTAFGTLKITTSVTGQTVAHGYMAMNVSTATFASSDVLGITYGTSTAANGGIYDVIIRYKDK